MPVPNIYPAVQFLVNILELAALSGGCENFRYDPVGIERRVKATLDSVWPEPVFSR
jgi:hypothetical protein